MVTEVQIVKRAKVRRAKLYYLRDRVGARANRLKVQKEEQTPVAVAAKATEATPEAEQKSSAKAAKATEQTAQEPASPKADTSAKESNSKKPASDKAS